MTAGAPAEAAGLAPEAVPYLPRGVRLHFDAVRQAWVLLAPERAIRLDQIGHAILSRVDGQRSFGAITRELADSFNAPEDQITRELADSFNAPEDQIARDSAGYLAALLDRRFLELRP
ncbi:MAG: pyrroloquinoline quinone biosynthesis peptide chaperone PqqD [Rhodovulum sulfidophilum]|uniref:Pyrroloquinoline quinone biosynthesis peptide chaperone PqqD n=1 Tax=Rhodovulum sulfidophilum TaxID=35806 RepID=A0A2W5Q538_RHOSU|nr:MAG: pyrroloquinoline quinone biosynthesis peptide chaperone PqqD [Rhodovulum sulfidophilum]